MADPPAFGLRLRVADRKGDTTPGSTSALRPTERARAVTSSATRRLREASWPGCSTLSVLCLRTLRGQHLACTNPEVQTHGRKAMGGSRSPRRVRAEGRSFVISFVVIAYNEEHHVCRCLEAIEARRDSGYTDHRRGRWVDRRHCDLGAEMAGPESTRCVCVGKRTGWSRSRPGPRGEGRQRRADRHGGRRHLARVHGLAPACRASRTTNVVGGTAVPDGDVAYLYNTFPG